MSFVIIYTKPADPYCVRAIAMLRAKRVVFEERPLPKHEAELIRRCGKTHCPQIFINEIHIGGFEELGSLELQGKLDTLLGEHGKAHLDFHEDQPRR